MLSLIMVSFVFGHIFHRVTLETVCSPVCPVACQTLLKLLDMLVKPSIHEGLVFGLGFVVIYL